MPQLMLDTFDVLAAWAALDAALAASIEVTLAAAAVAHPFATTQDALEVVIGAGALGHRIRRSIPATDLTAFDRLTLWHLTDVAMNGQPGGALQLRVQLGSAALPLGDPGNLWHRYLVQEAADVWSYGVFTLADLPAAIRGAVTEIEIAVTGSNGADHRLTLDALAADLSRMASDVDQGLLFRLNGILQFGGNPVPAIIDPAPPPALNQPAIRLIPYEVTRNDRRAVSHLRRADVTDAGYVMSPAPQPWDLFYRVEFLADSRAAQVAMVDFVTSQLGSHSWLPIGNRSFRVEQIEPTRPDDQMADGPSLRYRVSAWADGLGGSGGVAATPVADLQIATDLVPAGAGP